MTGSRPDALVFDFDGLILDTEMPEYLTVRAAFEDHGVELRLEDWLAVIGRADQPHWLDWLEDALGAPVERELVQARRRDEHHAMILRNSVLPGVVEVLDQAADRAIPVTVASSSPGSWVTGHLERLGLADRFAGIFSRDDVERAKPWPDLYLAAVGAVGADPRRSIAFEDSFHGSKAAEAAGLHCVAVPNELTAGQDFSHCAVVVRSLAEIDLDDLAGRLLGEAPIP